MLRWIAAVALLLNPLWVSPSNAEVKVYRSEKSPRLVLLIHGIGGTLDGTFESESHVQLGDLLVSDRAFQFSDVAALGYDASAFGRGERISDIAARLLQEISTTEELSISDYKSIVVVAHSMGGLVVREMILADSGPRDGPRPPTSLDLAVKVKDGGLIYIAVPMDGSVLATIGWKFLSLSAQDLEQNLGYDPQNYVDNLRGLWTNGRDVLATIRTYCAFETEPEYDLSIVVSAQSAEYLCTLAFLPLQYSHIQIVKPDSVDDPRYRFIRNSFLRIYPEVPNVLAAIPPEGGPSQVLSKGMKPDVVQARCAYDRFEGEERLLSQDVATHVFAQRPDLIRVTSAQQYFDWPWEGPKSKGYRRSIWADYQPPRVVSVHYSCFEVQPETEATRLANHEDFGRFAQAMHSKGARLLIYTKAVIDPEGESYIRERLTEVGLSKDKPDYCLISAHFQGIDFEGPAFARRYGEALDALLNNGTCPSPR